MNDQKTILIIEDEETLRHAVITKLEHEKFIVLHASDGLSGLDLALKEHPDIILLDIIMPVMDGLTVLKKLSEDAWGKTVPVILLTNLSDELKVTERFPGNVVKYLVKSDVNLEDIVNIIQEIGQHKAQ
ncbi:MAG TPA: response regulator [Candidatus Saccharimonadales bacterium]|nr:response regulator [Candidatus Saccharimonadales bacterium]